MASSRKYRATEETALGEAVSASLARHVMPGQRVVVALSGGVDSVVLLHVLADLRTDNRWGKHAYRLSALHVNHGLSPNADHWAVFCEALCASLNVPCECRCVDVDLESHDGLEGAARRARHAAFAQTVNADWILLAHHRDDQAETLLFNLLRGSGLGGAGAMRERNGRLLRPLLKTTRSMIESYARKRHLEWVEDESNDDTRHARNFLRGCVIPEISRRFPAAGKNLAAAAARFAEAEELLDDLARIDLGNAASFPVPVATVARLEDRNARNALRYMLKKNGVRIPSESRLREALRQMLAAGVDRHPEVKFGSHVLYRRRGLIHLGEAETRNQMPG